MCLSNVFFSFVTKIHQIQKNHILYNTYQKLVDIIPAY